MMATGLTTGNRGPASQDVPLPLGQGEAGFVQYERTAL